jgi:hypothetical protein
MIIFSFLKNLGWDGSVVLITFIVIALVICFVIAFFIYLLVQVALSSSDKEERDKKERIFLQYEAAKAVLRGNPNDLELREYALVAARIYYSSLRGGTLTIYDEQAISNDLLMIIGNN